MGASSGRIEFYRSSLATLQRLTYHLCDAIIACFALWGNLPNKYANYDQIGDMTCRNVDTTTAHTCGGSTPSGAAMTYDNEGRLVTWTAPSGTSANTKYLYDNEGNRVLYRTSTTVNGVNTTTNTITFDGYTEIAPNGSNTIKYYSENGQRVAMRVNGTLSYLHPDMLGSSSLAFTSAGAVQAAQLYAPYGSVRYTFGTMPGGSTEPFNFTGQRLDTQTGLLYYNARYYDPLSGRFTRADTVQNNAGGMDPYAYVGDNPVTRTDPGGHCWPLCTMLIGAVIGAAVNVGMTVIGNAIAGKPTTPGEVLQSAVVGAVSGAVSGLVGPEAGPVAKVAVGALANGVGQMAGNALSGKPLMDGVGEAVVSGAITGGVMEGAGSLLEGMGGKVLGKIASAVEGSCSFTPTTQVTTAQGKQAIGTLQVGQSVLAYNPKTRRMETEPILHVWIHPDSDLVDLTISTPIHAPHSTQLTWTRETLHTNQKHPFFTLERGFTAVGQLKQGMHILRADGRVGIITGWVRVPGTRIMYNLEVAHDHTFTVGTGQWVVHNLCDSTTLSKNMTNAGMDLLDGQQAHHLIPCACQTHPLVQMAGVDLNMPENGIGLFSNPYTALADGTLQHSGYHPSYNAAIKGLLDMRYTTLIDTGTINQSTAYDAVMQTMRDTHYMLQGMGIDIQWGYILRLT